MKKGLLLAALGLSCAFAFTSCDEKNGGEEPKVKYTMENPTNKAELDKIKDDFKTMKAEDFAKVELPEPAKTDVAKWAKENADAKAADAQAEMGKIGYLMQGADKKRYVNANGVEPIQLIYKGLIGAYQLKGLNGAVMAGVMAKDEKARAEALNKCVVYLLGDLKLGKTKDDFVAEGNSWGKYLTSISKTKGGKYENLDAKLNAEITKAYTVLDKKDEYTACLTKITEIANLVTAFRGVHYLAKYGDNIRQKGGFEGGNIHELSEGLGFVYSLQFAFNTAKHSYFLSKEDAQAVASINLWEDSQKSSADSELTKMAKKVADMFGFTVEEAKA